MFVLRHRLIQRSRDEVVLGASPAPVYDRSYLRNAEQLRLFGLVPAFDRDQWRRTILVHGVAVFEVLWRGC